MASLPPTPIRVACYARVSTEDQAERQTVQAQIDFDRRYCELHGLTIAGIYVDDGISGTVPLDDGRMAVGWWKMPRPARSRWCWSTGWTGSADRSRH